MWRTNCMLEPAIRWQTQHSMSFTCVDGRLLSDLWTYKSDNESSLSESWLWRDPAESDTDSVLAAFRTGGEISKTSLSSESTWSLQSQNTKPAGMYRSVESNWSGPSPQVDQKWSPWMRFRWNLIAFVASISSKPSAGSNCNKCCLYVDQSKSKFQNQFWIGGKSLRLSIHAARSRRYSSGDLLASSSSAHFILLSDLHLFLFCPVLKNQFQIGLLNHSLRFLCCPKRNGRIPSIGNFQLEEFAAFLRFSFASLSTSQNMHRSSISSWTTLHRKASAGLHLVRVPCICPHAQLAQLWD